MNGLGRIFTDPASVNHETDWGFWNWVGAAGYSAFAAVLVLAGCVAVVSAARGFARYDIPLGATATAALGLLGIPLLMHAVHGMARHTAGMGWVMALIIAVYGLSFAAVWFLGPLLVRTLLGPEDYEEDRKTVWRRQLLVVGAVLGAAAVVNLTVEGLNKVSGSIGVAISMLVFVAVCGVGWFSLQAMQGSRGR